jgi:hypothetical protein
MSFLSSRNFIRLQTRRKLLSLDRHLTAARNSTSGCVCCKLRLRSDNSAFRRTREKRGEKYLDVLFRSLPSAYNCISKQIDFHFYLKFFSNSRNSSERREGCVVHLGTTVTNQRYINEETENRLNLGNACLLPFSSENFVFLSVT